MYYVEKRTEHIVRGSINSRYYDKWKALSCNLMSTMWYGQGVKKLGQMWKVLHVWQVVATKRRSSCNSFPNLPGRLPDFRLVLPVVRAQVSQWMALAPLWKENCGIARPEMAKNFHKRNYTSNLDELVKLLHQADDTSVNWLFIQHGDMSKHDTTWYWYAWQLQEQ